MLQTDTGLCVADHLHGQIADADFQSRVTTCILAGIAGKLKHVKLLPGSIKTQEGQAVKELSEASWESRTSLWIACKWAGNKL